MGASGDAVDMLDLVLRKLLRKVPDRGEQRIFETAADPEEFHLIVDASRVRQDSFEVDTSRGWIIRCAHGWAESRDTAEQIEVRQSERQRLRAAE